MPQSHNITCCGCSLYLDRYSEEVRRVVKDCYEEVWNLLEEHREALWAGRAERKQNDLSFASIDLCQMMVYIIYCNTL